MERLTDISTLGSLVFSILNRDLLERVARSANGSYMSGGSDLNLLTDDIVSLQAGAIGDRVLTRPIERFSIFVAVAFIALSLEIMLTETRREAT